MNRQICNKESEYSGAENSIFLENLHAFSPSLRVYAIMLLGSTSEADDLVQETLLRAWRYRDSFRDDTNPRAWLFRILKNEFLSWVRRERHVEDVGGRLAARLAVPESQELTVRCSETFRALERLSPLSREVLGLMAAGCSYKEAAEICRCSIGTFKSRVNRARQSLVTLIDGERAD